MPPPRPSTSSPPDSHAKTSASQDNKPESTATAPGSGGPSGTLLATYDPDGSCWRTSQQSLLTADPPLLDRLPNWGTTAGGGLYERPTPAHLTNAPAGSALLPTATASDSKASGGAAYNPANVTLTDAMVRLLPTPLARDWKGKSTSRWDMPTAAERMLPTPAAWDGDRGPDLARANRPDSGGMDLVTTVERLLTVGDDTPTLFTDGNNSPDPHHHQPPTAD